MKQFITYLLAPGILMSLFACNDECIQGSGNQITQNRTVEPFTEIETGGSVKLVLKQDSVYQLRVEADDNVQEHIKTSVSHDKLTIDMDGNFCNSGSITIYASAKNFTGVSASGAVEVNSDGRLNAGDFNLMLSGNSRVDLDLSAANVAIKSSGSSEIELSGQARSNRLELSGATKINAFDFVVADYDIKTSGASKCRINVLNNLNIESSGASEIEYKGNPQHIDNDKSGASSVRKVD